MKKSFLSQLNRSVKSIALTAVSAMLLGGCGGGGGGSQESQVTPASLDGVTLRLFDALTIQFQKRGGSSGNEYGAAIYDGLSQTFFVGTGSLGQIVTLPVDDALTGMQYQFTRTSINTGVIKLTGFNRQIYPGNVATITNKEVGSTFLFWSKHDAANPNAVDITLDVLFAETGGKLQPQLSLSAENYIKYSSNYIPDLDPTKPGKITRSSNEVSFATKTAQFSLTAGGLMPSGYLGRDYGPNDPYLGIWTGLSNPKRNLLFTSASILTAPAKERYIQHSSTTVIPSLPIEGLNNTKIQDAGIVSVRDVDTATTSVNGAYSYANVGQSLAKFSLQYGGGVPIHFTLTFTSSAGGSFTASNGETGTFMEDPYDASPASAP